MHINKDVTLPISLFVCLGGLHLPVLLIKTLRIVVFILIKSKIKNALCKAFFGCTPGNILIICLALLTYKAQNLGCQTQEDQRNNFRILQAP